MPLADGCHHVALLTEDLDRLCDFYGAVFDARVAMELEEGPMRHALVDLGGGFHLHPFEFAEATDDAQASPEMFGRGHLDHVSVSVDDPHRFETVRGRLVERGASDGTLTDFGLLATVWFEDPDGMGGEIAISRTGAPRRFEESTTETYDPASTAMTAAG